MARSGRTLHDSNRHSAIDRAADRAANSFHEVANAMVRKVIRGETLIDRAVKDCQKLPMFFDEIVGIEDVLPLAMRSAERFRHPVYDLIYLELAYRRDTRFVTADRRLAMKLVNTPLARHIVLLSDWQPS